MINNFTTSVNIIRDSETTLTYIPTPNVNRVLDVISDDFLSGIRSFNIIGSYGTGKSAFLWAFQQSMLKRRSILDVTKIFHETIDTINIVGEYRSLQEKFSEIFNLPINEINSNAIFDSINKRVGKNKSKNSLLIITIDEFGKYLEFASKNNPESELYFIQQLAEQANNKANNIILLTAIHQNFDAYAQSLTTVQKQEWTKVKGRFKELTFNEPVEQLIYLASEHIEKSTITKVQRDKINIINDIFIRSKAFYIDTNYLTISSKKLFPLDIFAASVLTLCLQRYAQNERSLFSFLASKDHTSVQNFQKSKNNFYGIPEVYDYLVYNLYSFINSRYNPDFPIWMSIRNALERVENTSSIRSDDYGKLIKVIGLLSLTGKKGSSIDRNLLVTYCKFSLGMSDADIILNDLEQKKIVLYRNYTNRYALFEGTDLDFSQALSNAERKLSEITDLANLLKKDYTLPPVAAKRISLQSGTPRFFEYRISSMPINAEPKGEIDGIINFIFNDEIEIDTIKSASQSQEEAILYAYFVDSKNIKNLLFEIEKTKLVISENLDDKVAVKELSSALSHQVTSLTDKLVNNFYSATSEVIWIYNGKKIEIGTKKIFNEQLSKICEGVYSKTPFFNNELVNKHKISSSIHSAKKSYFRALSNNWEKENLGFEDDKFPPEKTIYLSLLKNNNIDLSLEPNTIYATIDKRWNFHHIWEASENFVKSTRSSRKSLSSLVTILSKRPYKLKQGLIDFWVPTFLFIKRDEFSLFGQSGYIPSITDDLLDLISKNPEQYEIKAFDIDGIKLEVFNSYRRMLSQQEESRFTGSNFIETIRPFLAFYRELPEYSKNTSRLSQNAQKVRRAIATSKDPEKTFFEDFPIALGYSLEQIQASEQDLGSYVHDLRSAIKEIRTSFDELVYRIDSYIQEDIIGTTASFDEYKLLLQERYRKLRKHMLLPQQKVFIQRLDSLIDNKIIWLNSLVQSLVGSTLDRLRDEDEILIYDRFREMVLALDSLTTISASDFEEEKEDIYHLQINSFVHGLNKTLVRLPKNKLNEAQRIEENLRSNLGTDKGINLAALTSLIKDLLK